MVEEGNVFVIEGEEYRLRLINKFYVGFLERVLFRTETHCITGGKNLVYTLEELEQMEKLKTVY